jgi:hypothetical protein
MFGEILKFSPHFKIYLYSPRFIVEPLPVFPEPWLGDAVIWYSVE